MAGPEAMDGPFTEPELTERVLEEFRLQEGAPCPTPMHAIRYSQLCMALEGHLKPGDMQAYKDAIRLKKKQGASAQEIETADTVIRIIEATILGASPHSKEKVKKWRQAKGNSASGLRRLATGTPVRLAADASRRGMIATGWTFQHSSDLEPEVCVRFDGDDHTTNVRRDEVVTLCAAGCGGDAPSQRCSRCGSTFYCSKSCQGSHWKVHRSSCQGPATQAPAASDAAAAACDGSGAHDSLAVGSRVRVEGLQSSPQYNSSVGEVTGVAPGGRIAVKLQGSGQVLSLKRENLREEEEGGGGVKQRSSE